MCQLLAAIEDGDATRLGDLLQSAQSDISSKQLFKAFIQAAEKSQTNHETSFILDIILNDKRILGDANDNFCTLIHYVCENGSPKALKWLLDNFKKIP